MALYQPTNITPDLVSGVENGVVFVNPGGTVDVSWAVNGNSVLTAYQIEFFRNDAASTAGTSTGKVVLDTPFSPISADGTERRFSVSLPYGVGGTYFTIAAADANKQGKIRITQWWGDGTGQSIVQRSLSVFRITARSSIGVSGPTVSGGVRSFTGEITLPSYALYGDSAVLWARWHICDAESGETVQDTGKVWGATSYDWTADPLPPGSYFAVFSAATSNGETLEAIGATFSVLSNAATVDGALSIACDKANRAVQITANDTIAAEADLRAVSLTQDDGLVITEPDGFGKWTFPVVTNEENWAFSWRGRVTGDGASPVFRLTLQDGRVVSFGIVWNATYNVYAPVYVSPAAELPGNPPQALSDQADILVTFGYRAPGVYGWFLGAYNQSGDYDPSVEWSEVPFVASPPVQIELLPGAETRDFCLCFGADGLQAVEDYVETGDYTQPEGTTIGLVPTQFAVNVYLFGPQLSMTIWRQKTGSNSLVRIGDFLSGDDSVFLDYGAGNGNEYSYMVVVETDSVAILGRSEAITPCFWDWVLIEAQNVGTASQPEYRSVNVFRFGLNLSSGSNGNGNSPNVISNFTPYPTVLRDTQNRQSGTLTALIGSITAPGEYTDSNALRDKIRALSVSQNTLFLRNRRGDFMMVAIAGEISTDTADNSHKQQLNATIHWVEIGPVSGSVVQIVSGGGSE